MVENAAGAPIPPREREILTQGPREIDFVCTALEETMAVAYQKLREVWKQRAIPDPRTAAFHIAIEKVGASYLAKGIFP
jgi:glutamate dehydrogenase (NAD(P)+)